MVIREFVLWCVYPYLKEQTNNWFQNRRNVDTYNISLHNIDIVGGNQNISLFYILAEAVIWIVLLLGYQK